MLSKIKYYLRVTKANILLGLKELVVFSIAEMIMWGILAAITALYFFLFK